MNNSLVSVILKTGQHSNTNSTKFLSKHPRITKPTWLRSSHSCATNSETLSKALPPAQYDLGALGKTSLTNSLTQEFLSETLEKLDALTNSIDSNIRSTNCIPDGAINGTSSEIHTLRRSSSRPADSSIAEEIRGLVNYARELVVSQDICCAALGIY